MAISNQKKGSILLIKGIDVELPDEYIDDSAARNSENFEVRRNILTKRNGTSLVGEVIIGTDLEIMAGREFVREDVKYNIRVGRDKVEKYNTTTSLWEDITGTTALTGTTTDLFSTAVPMLSGQPILCISNGKDVIQKWNTTGTLADLGGTPPVAKFIQEYKTYLVCANIAGGTDIAQRVQWCDTADPEEWSAGNSGTVDLIEDGGSITGLNLFGNYVCVHKNESIYLGYLVSSTDVFKFDRKSTGVGTIANGSIQNLPTGEQIFLARDGLHIFNGISALVIKSGVNEEIRDGLNKQYASKAWSLLVQEKDEVWIGIPIGDQTTGETVYKYNYLTKTILKDTRPLINCAWRGAATVGLSWDDMIGSWDSNNERWDGTGLLVSADTLNLSSTDGYTYKIDPSTNSDNAVAVKARWETKDFINDQESLCRWNGLQLWAKGNSVRVQYSTDGGDTWTDATGSPMTINDKYPADSSPDIFYFDVVSSKIRFRFSNDELDGSLAIKQFIISYTVREMRQ